MWAYNGSLNKDTCAFWVEFLHVNNPRNNTNRKQKSVYCSEIRLFVYQSFHIDVQCGLSC